MTKSPCMLAILFLASAAMLTGCKSPQVVYGITSGSENLKALTKITDNSDMKVKGLAVAYDSPTMLVSLYDGHNAHIYKKDNPLSAAMSQITSGTGLWCGAPSFNPKTGKIAFTYAPKLASGYWSKNDIYIIDLKNVNALIPVTQTATSEEYSPSFSSDGNFIVYQTNIGYYGEIWYKNFANNENILLGKGFQPQLSPDGTKIVFARKKDNSQNSTSSIWVMNIDGSNVTQLTNNAQEWASEPSWSPDGTKIVYTSYVKGKKENRDIYMMNADGTGLVQLTTNESYEGTPRWSGDGNLYFISDRGSKKGDYQVWRFNMNWEE